LASEKITDSGNRKYAMHQYFTEDTAVELAIPNNRRLKRVVVQLVFEILILA
jgi:hypothetical protein